MGQRAESGVEELKQTTEAEEKAWGDKMDKAAEEPHGANTGRLCMIRVKFTDLKREGVNVSAGPGSPRLKLTS